MNIKKFAAIIVVAMFCTATYSQTLFTYGTKQVSKDEFLKAFNKNPDTTGSKSEKIKEYLDMYINFKLKIQAARDEKLNQGDTYKSEAENFRNQLIENYINEQANINGLVQEAFKRSQKDILLAHVFVEVKPSTDTIKAYEQIKQAYDALKGGKDFGEVALSYSTDEGIKQTKGIIGYITVFTLPYEIENMVYALQPGAYSNIYRSNIGYHIFKNVSERPAVGKRKIKQILVATPQNFTDDERKAAARLSDSVYQQLLNGALFEKMLQLYGAPAANSDEANILEVGVGQYNSDYENEVFALKKPGDISKPFVTAYGYNIIKLVEVKPVSADENDVINRAHLQEMVERDHRLTAAKDALIEKWMKETKFTQTVYNTQNLWSYTDSSLKKGKTIPDYKNIAPQTTLFSFAKQKITVADWLQFNREAMQAGVSKANKDYNVIIKEFIKTACDKYYRSHIEDFYPPIAVQVKEFNEANLLFAVMDKYVWSKAAQDSVGLKNYYSQHKQQYTWQPGVSALVVSSASKEAIDSLALQLKNNGTNWRSIVSGYNNTVMADSSRFENGQLPLKQKIPMQKGFISQSEQNDAGDAYTFVYIFDVYPQSAPRSFDDARGLVINDYQQVLEQKWITELKKKYPVKVNEAVAKNL
jgi:peptidyl-prolyl cis-trans isomerase SurA